MAKAKRQTIHNYKDNFVHVYPTAKATAYSKDDRENGIDLHPDVAARFIEHGFATEKQVKQKSGTTEEVKKP